MLHYIYQHLKRSLSLRLGLKAPELMFWMAMCRHSHLKIPGGPKMPRVALSRRAMCSNVTAMRGVAGFAVRWATYTDPAKRAKNEKAWPCVNVMKHVLFIGNDVLAPFLPRLCLLVYFISISYMQYECDNVFPNLICIPRKRALVMNEWTYILWIAFAPLYLQLHIDHSALQTGMFFLFRELGLLWPKLDPLQPVGPSFGMLFLPLFA